MINGARRLSEGATKDWHGGEDEFNPRFLEGMKLAIAQKNAQRELELAKFDTARTYNAMRGSAVTSVMFLAGALLFAAGFVLAGWIGAILLASVAFVVHSSWFLRGSVQKHLRSIEHERAQQEALQRATEEANEKQRQLDEGIKIVEPVALPETKVEEQRA